MQIVCGGSAIGTRLRVIPADPRLQPEEAKPEKMLPTQNFNYFVKMISSLHFCGSIIASWLKKLKPQHAMRRTSRFHRLI